MSYRRIDPSEYPTRIRGKLSEFEVFEYLATDLKSRSSLKYNRDWHIAWRGFSSTWKILSPSWEDQIMSDPSSPTVDTYRSFIHAMLLILSVWLDTIGLFCFWQSVSFSLSDQLINQMVQFSVLTNPVSRAWSNRQHFIPLLSCNSSSMTRPSSLYLISLYLVFLLRREIINDIIVYFLSTGLNE